MNRRQQKLLIGLVVGLAIALFGVFSERYSPAQTLRANVEPGFYKVSSFQDGDTITILMDGREEKIRMIGVDTPETHDPRKPVQCFGRAASAFTKNLIGEGGTVRLEADSLSSNRDRYDRLLRYVYIPDGRLVQAEIIGQGYGFAYTNFPFTKSDEFKSLETTAREQNRGLWGSCETTVNDYGGLTSSPE